MFILWCPCTKRCKAKYYTQLCHGDSKIPRHSTNYAIDHSSGIDSKDFIELYRKCLAELYSFLIIGTTLPSNDALHFWKNLLEV